MKDTKNVSKILKIAMIVLLALMTCAAAFTVMAPLLALAEGSAAEAAGTAQFNVAKSLVISLVIGFVIALIVTSVMKAQLKSVRKQHGAANYEKAGSFNLEKKRDIFLYETTTSREKPKSKEDNNNGKKE